MLERVKKLITHSGSFHADDIFASATLALLFEREGQKFEIIRTRDPEIIKTADYVYDVGLIHDEATNRFDHHQPGGAGKGPEGIDYSSFGLVWRKFGAELCENQKVADIINKKLVVPIDAGDNGFDIVKSIYPGIFPYTIQSFFFSMGPTWKENDLSRDDQFLKCVEIAKGLLLREITLARDFVLAEESVRSAYNNTQDKRLIMLDDNYPAEAVLIELPEPLFVLYPRTDGTYGVKAVPKGMRTFEPRKPLPESWAGLSNEELQKVTGVPDAVFAHRALFLAVAKSKEGAFRLAKLALDSALGAI